MREVKSELKAKDIFQEGFLFGLEYANKLLTVMAGKGGRWVAGTYEEQIVDSVLEECGLDGCSALKKEMLAAMYKPEHYCQDDLAKKLEKERKSATS